MTFPKAEKGIKKVYIAHLMSLFGSVFESAAALFGIFYSINIGNFAETSFSIADHVMLGLSLVSLFLLGLGFILNFIGVFTASGDDENFKVAMYSIVLSLIIQAAGIIWSAYSSVITITNLLTTVTGFLSTIYIIQGIRSLAAKLGCDEMDKTGGKLYVFFSFMFVMMTFSDVAVLIVNDSEASVASPYLQFFGGILSIVQLVLLLSYLNKAKKMLAAKYTNT